MKEANNYIEINTTNQSLNQNNSSKLPILADLHLHTDASHGKSDARTMFESCCAKGLKIIGFSEHSPRPEGYSYACDYQEHLAVAFPEYVKYVLDFKKEAKDKGIIVLLGLEIDYIKGYEDYAKKLCTEYDYDYIIGGLHFQGNWGFDGPSDDWLKINKEQRYSIFERYYEDMISMCQAGLFNIVAHPDLIKIHSVADFHDWLLTPKAQDVITRALKSIRDNNMSMEVSSAGLRKPCKEIYPCPQIMTLAANLGVPISFASDAHCADTPTYAFFELARYAGHFGYKESVVFMEGKKRLLKFSVPALLNS